MSNENEEGMTMGEALMKLGNSNVISKDCCKKVRGENRHTKSGSFNLVQFRSKSVLKSAVSFNFRSISF